jgi:hypothetical protein
MLGRANKKFGRAGQEAPGSGDRLAEPLRGGLNQARPGNGNELATEPLLGVFSGFGDRYSTN